MYTKMTSVERNQRQWQQTYEENKKMKKIIPALEMMLLPA